MQLLQRRLNLRSLRQSILKRRAKLLRKILNLRMRLQSRYSSVMTDPHPVPIDLLSINKISREDKNRKARVLISIRVMTDKTDFSQEMTVLMLKMTETVKVNLSREAETDSSRDVRELITDSLIKMKDSRARQEKSLSHSLLSEVRQ